MKLRKKVISTVLATAMTLGTVSVSLAADFDIKNINTNKTTGFNSYMFDNATFADLVFNSTDYLIESGDKFYKASEVIPRSEDNPGLTLAQIVSTLTPVDDQQTGELKVESVSAINAEEIKVTFNKDVDVTSASKIGNYEVKVNNIVATIENTIDVDGNTALLRIKANIPGPAQRKLQSGDKIVVQANDAIESVNGEKLDRYASDVKVYNVTQEPKLEKTAISGTNLVLTFDRPVNTSTTLIKVDNEALASNSLSASAATVAGNYEYTVSLTAAEAKEAKKVGTHKLVIFDVADTAAVNPIVASVINESYVISENDVPEVVSIKALNANKFFIETTDAVTLAGTDSLKIKKGNYTFTTVNVAGAGAIGTTDSSVFAESGTYKGNPGYFVAVTKDYTVPTNDLNPLYASGESNVTLNVEFENYSETGSSLIGKKYVGSVSLSKDDTKPSIDETNLDVVNEELEVTFNSTLNAAPTATEIIVRDKDGVIVPLSNGHITLSTNIMSNDTVTIDLSAAGANVGVDEDPYTVEFKADKLKYADITTSAAVYVVDSKKNDKLIATVNSVNNNFKYREFTTAGSVGAVSGNIIPVDYGVKMDSSALLVGNYKLDGEALPAGTTVDFVGDKENVQITLPKGTLQSSTDYKLTISTSVKTEANEAIVKDLQTKTAYETVVSLTDNVKPTLAEAKYLVADNDVTTTNKIKVTFNEDLQALGSNPQNNVKVVINGSEQTGFSVVDGTVGDKVITIDLVSPVNINQAATITIVPNSSDAIVIKDTAGNEVAENSTITTSGKELDTSVIAQNAVKDATLQAKTVASLSVADTTGAANNGKVTASWTALNAGEITAMGATGYEIYYIDTATLAGAPLTKTTAGATKVTVANATTATTDISGLTDATGYTFVIYAVNARTNSTVSAEDTATPADYVATAGTITGGANFTSADLSSMNAGTSLTITIDGTDYDLANAALKAWNNTAGHNAIGDVAAFLGAAVDSTGAALSTVADITNDGSKITITSKTAGGSSSVTFTITDGATDTAAIQGVFGITSGTTNTGSASN